MPINTFDSLFELQDTDLAQVFIVEDARCIKGKSIFITFNLFILVLLSFIFLQQLDAVNTISSTLSTKFKVLYFV